MLAVAEDFYDLKPSWITQDLEDLGMHNTVYVLLCIHNVKVRFTVPHGAIKVR
jgi:hypothetical protein